MKRIFSILIFLLVATPLFAQNQIYVYPYPIIPFESIVIPGLCNETILIPGTYPPFIIAQTSNTKLVWCSQEKGDSAKAWTYTLQIDTGAINPLVVNCNTDQPSTCVSVIPAAAITTLQLKTNHTVNLSVNNQVNGASSTLSFSVRRPICTYDGIIYEVGQPLPASVPGALRNNIGQFSFETLIGNLMQAGFYVDFQRSQFGLDQDGSKGYNFLWAWCAGK